MASPIHRLSPLSPSAGNIGNIPGISAQHDVPTAAPSPSVPWYIAGYACIRVIPGMQRRETLCTGVPGRLPKTLEFDGLTVFRAQNVCKQSGRYGSDLVFLRAHTPTRLDLKPKQCVGPASHFAANFPAIPGFWLSGSTLLPYTSFSGNQCKRAKTTCKPGKWRV